MRGGKGEPAWRRWKRHPRRHRDWESRLVAYLEAASDRPHAYGRHDCLMFCAAAIEAQTGRDFAEGHRGAYRSAAGAARYLKRLGFRSIEELLDSVLSERPVAFARRGDIVLADGIPGLCIGGEALFVGQEGAREGLVRRPRSEWQKAWAV